MLIECFGSAASGKTTITKKLEAYFGAPTQPKKQIKFLESDYRIMERYALALSKIKDKIEYYEHRTLIKWLQKRLKFRRWAKQQNLPLFRSEGILQSALSLFLRYEGLPSDEEIQILIAALPIPNRIIYVHADLTTSIQRHLKRTRNSNRVQKLYMVTDREMLSRYIQKQNQIISLCYECCPHLRPRTFIVTNNYNTKEELFSSPSWVNLIKAIEELK